jgi:predicted anti-sigma-YlaC factor YlaD
MNCDQIRELLPDLAAGMEAATPEVGKHIASCKACADYLHEFQQTMSLLDEWQAPEPSPYFDTRMQARLREEMARPHRSWTLAWLRHPVWAMSFAVVLFAGAFMAGNQSYFVEPDPIATNPPSLGLPVEPGTAVGDLQALVKNDDLYADFEVLDDLQLQDNVTENP